MNPVQHVLAAHGALSSLSAAHQRVLTGRQFFPELISGPFHDGLSVVLLVATALSMIAALASMMRGRHDAGHGGARRRLATATAQPAADSGADGPGRQRRRRTEPSVGERTGSGARTGSGQRTGSGERTGSPQQISA